jgi:acyl carrier protein
MTDTKSRVAACVSTVVGQPVSPEDTRDILVAYQLDSLDVVELVSELELAFDCQLDITDTASLRTLTAMATAVEQALNQ